jgi:hypothetical protein
LQTLQQLIRVLAWNRPQLPTALIFLLSIHFAKLAGKTAWRVCALPEQTKAHMAKHVERASCAASNSHSETREFLQELGRPVTAEALCLHPHRMIFNISCASPPKCSYWLGSAAKNAAVGIAIS